MQESTENTPPQISDPLVKAVSDQATHMNTTLVQDLRAERDALLGRLQTIWTTLHNGPTPPLVSFDELQNTLVRKLAATATPPESPDQCPDTPQNVLGHSEGLSAVVTELRRAVDSLTRQLASLRSAKSDLLSRLADASSAHRRLEEDRDRLQVTLSEVSSALGPVPNGGIVAAVRQLQKALLDAQEGLGPKIVELREIIAGQTRQLENLQARAEAVRLEFSKYIDDFLQLRNERDQLQAELTKATAAQQMFKADLVATTDAIRSDEAQNSLGRSYQKVVEERDQLKADCKGLREELVTLRTLFLKVGEIMDVEEGGRVIDAARALKNELDDLRHTHSSLHGQLNIAKGVVAELTNQRDQLNKQVIDLEEKLSRDNATDPRNAVLNELRTLLGCNKNHLPLTEVLKERLEHAGAFRDVAEGKLESLRKVCEDRSREFNKWEAKTSYRIDALETRRDEYYEVIKRTARVVEGMTGCTIGGHVGSLPAAVAHVINSAREHGDGHYSLAFLHLADHVRFALKRPWEEETVYPTTVSSRAFLTKFASEGEATNYPHDAATLLAAARHLCNLGFSGPVPDDVADGIKNLRSALRRLGVRGGKGGAK